MIVRSWTFGGKPEQKLFKGAPRGPSLGLWRTEVALLRGFNGIDEIGLSAFRFKERGLSRGGFPGSPLVAASRRRRR
jgi:hypothetical protein